MDLHKHFSGFKGEWPTHVTTRWGDTQECWRSVPRKTISPNPTGCTPLPCHTPHQYHNLSCPAIPSVLSIRIREPARPLRLSVNFCVIAGTQKQPSVCVSMRTRAWAQMSRSGAVSMRLLWTQQGNASEAWPTQWLPSEWMEFKMATLTSWACRRKTIPLSFFPLARFLGLSHSGFSLFFHHILSARRSPMRHFRCDGDLSGVLWCTRIPGFTPADLGWLLRRGLQMCVKSQGWLIDFLWWSG